MTIPFRLIRESRLFNSESVFARVAGGITPNREILERGRFSLGQIHWLSDNLRKSAEVYPLLLFTTCRFLEVTGPVDRVYGSFGLMGDQVQQHIPVDYSASGRKAFWKLYIEVATFLLKDSLDVLNEAESMHRPPQLPTFVPNWHSKHPSSERFPLIFTAGIEESRQEFTSSVAIINETLIMRGLLVGKIADTLPSYTPALNGTTSDKGPDGNAARILKVIEDASSKYKQYYPLALSEAGIGSLARAWKMNAFYRPKTESFQQYSQDVREDFLYVLKFLEWKKTGSDDIEVTREGAEQHLVPYMTHLRQISVGRRFIFTRDGRIGLASQSCKPADLVCIFLGARNPHVLRKVENQDAYELIGAAYVDGVMDGEALRASDTSQLQNFTII